MRQHQIHPKTQHRKPLPRPALPIPLQLNRILSTQAPRRRNPTDHSDLMRIYQRPAAAKPRVLRRLPVQQPQPGYHEDVVLPGVAELVPPVRADLFGAADLGLRRPETAVAGDV
ncbi:hypothetical protein TWF696_008525 [Orbilia brochopaga]|uniref:Uncharacterized protein n=1 Tax=Orbilia brochopaga TaxID=3140254 RepID=A0AAV9UH70_9PEZI